MDTDPDHSDGSLAERSPRQPMSPVPDHLSASARLADETFDALADSAKKLADVIEANAVVLQQAAESPGHDRDAHEHTARDQRLRRLAAAIRDVAEAFETRQLPSEETRRIIRDP